MTLEELVKIIVEAVERHFFLDRQKVLALCFDEANKAELLEAANSINGRADYFSAADIERVGDGYDAMFVDYIPIFGVAEPALGLCITPWGKLMAAMVSRSKPVFQLKKAPSSYEINPACRELLKEHWARLYSLGVVLLDNNAGGGHAGPKVPAKGEAVYAKNVLSRQDIYGYLGINRLVVGKDVVVTALAADTAKALKIELARQE